MTTFSYIQTFFLNKDAVGGSPEATLTSIDLFFKRKPKNKNNTSGILNPGVILSICEVIEDEPSITNIIDGSIVHKGYNDIAALSDASASTSFTFKTPLTLKTNAYYGIVVLFEDPDYELWMSVQGDKIVNTNTPSPGPSGKNDGSLYTTTNDNKMRAMSSSDLKFVVNAAKYSANTGTIDLVPSDFEFLTISNVIGNFIGGENVYVNGANVSGTVIANTNSSTLTGNGTLFEGELAPNEKVLITDGTPGNSDIRIIQHVSSNTALTLNIPPSFSNSQAVIQIVPVAELFDIDYLRKKAILFNSNANTTVKFTNGASLIGDVSGASMTVDSVDVKHVDEFIPELGVIRQSLSNVLMEYNFAYNNGSAYVVDSNNFTNLENGVVNSVKKYDGVVLSKSIEVDNASSLYKNSVSGVITLDLSVDQANVNLFQSPHISTDAMDVYLFEHEINNDATGEHTNYGNAHSKHITNTITFANNNAAEDIRVYATVHMPKGTDLKFYARIHNSDDPDAFDDKYWTELERIASTKQFSSINSDDLIEQTYGFPQYPKTLSVLAGTYTTELGNNVIVSTNDNSSSVANNDLVKIYNPLFPNTNYQVAVVENSNSTALVLSDPISNNGIVGAGIKVDKLELKHTAFNNIMNDNVVRYYNDSMVEYDTYNSFSVKIVFLSNSSHIVPTVDDIRVIGVSA